MRHRAALLVLAISFSSQPLLAQDSWGITPEIGSARFSGNARSISDETLSGHPDGASTWGIRFDRSSRRLRLSVGVLYASTGVVFEDDQVIAGIKNALTLLEVTPELSATIFHVGGGQLRLHGGMAIDRWSPDGDNRRTALGGLGALSLEAPLTPRLNLAVRWEAVITGSVFDENDLPSTFERAQGVRQRFGIGARVGI
ncbi:MAG: hypothetical protein ABI613_03450 [Gemmatimonadota bacterium]